MEAARKQAECEYALLDRVRKSNCTRKMSKPLTEKQLSSKRSAEICRAKFSIYVSLLEAENSSESHQIIALQASSTRLLEDIEALRQKISMAEELHSPNLEKKTAYGTMVELPEANLNFRSESDSETNDSSLESFCWENCPEDSLKCESVTKMEPFPGSNDQLFQFGVVSPWSTRSLIPLNNFENVLCPARNSKVVGV